MHFPCFSFPAKLRVLLGNVMFCCFRHLLTSFGHTPYVHVLKMLKFSDWKEFLDVSLYRLCRDRNLYKQFRQLETNSERIRFASTVRFEFLSEELITALHWTQGGLVVRKVSVRPSVRLSVRQTHALWQNGRKICPDFYTIRISFSLVFWERECLVGRATTST